MKKLFVLSPKRMALLTCVLAAALMFGAVNMPAVVASATQRQLPIYCVERDQKMISISFDAAWGNARVRSLGPNGSGGHILVFMKKIQKVVDIYLRLC